MQIPQIAATLCLSFVLAACATAPLSEQLTGRKIPAAGAAPATGETAQLLFSADRKYETAKGVPFEGDPLVCTDGKVYRVNGGEARPNGIAVKAGQELAVTSVIAWENTGFRKLCGPLVRFTPEAGATYVVVNERIGGKGISAMWTGIARQTCQVSVYRQTVDGFVRVPARPHTDATCRTEGA
jgi:hypothetical protein